MFLYIYISGDFMVFNWFFFKL